MAPRFEVYLALGDSMSIDSYPFYDLGETVEEERLVGAASLLYKNDSQIWPEFEGRDLTTLQRGIEFINYTFDGATTNDLLERSGSIAAHAGKRVLATLTIGGNDLLNMHLRGASRSDRKAFLTHELEELRVRFDCILSMCLSSISDITIVLTTVYDPTDGTGMMPGAGQKTWGNFDLDYLHQYNDFIRTTAAYGKNLLLADVHGSFLGHGSRARESADFWYWKPSPIEPGARGASEIRSVWLKTLSGVLESAM